MSDIRSMSWSSFFHASSENEWQRRILRVVLLGILLRLVMAFAIVPGMQQMGDGPAYVRQVHQIFAGTLDHFYFPPGTALVTMPVFGMFGFSIAAEHLAGVLISIGFLLSTVYLARSMQLSGRATFLAALIVALYPHVVLSSAQISSLPLTAIFVSMAVGGAVRASRMGSAIHWCMTSLFCGLAVLTRPGTLLLAPLLMILGWSMIRHRPEYWRPASVAATIMAVILCLMTLPVVSFHAGRGHGSVLATNSEWNLLLSNNRYTPDYKTGHFGQRALTDIDAEAETFIRAFFTGETAENATQRQREVMLDSARRFMAQNPGRTAWRMTNRVRGFFGCDYTAARELQLVFGYSDAVFGLVMMAEGGFFLLVLCGWLVFIVAYTASPVPGRWFHIALLVAIIAPHVVAFSLAKYHLPLVPIMICASGLVGSWLLNPSGECNATFGKRRKVLVILGVALAFVQVEHLYNLVILR
jgi:4-amino-4-deoxy-L-arabinose transferase-like glycosyltransferase